MSHSSQEPGPGSHFQPATAVMLLLVALFIASAFLILRAHSPASTATTTTTTTTTTPGHHTTTTHPPKARVTVQVANGTNTAAFGGTSITGATAAGVSYTLSADGQYVTSADVYFTADESANNVDAGFGTSATNGQLIACTASSTPVGGSGTYAADYDAHCDFAGSTTFGPAGVPVTSANYFDASVTDQTGNVNGVTVNP